MAQGKLAICIDLTHLVGIHLEDLIDKPVNTLNPRWIIIHRSLKYSIDLGEILLRNMYAVEKIAKIKGEDQCVLIAVQSLFYVGKGGIPPTLILRKVGLEQVGGIVTFPLSG